MEIKVGEYVRTKSGIIDKVDALYGMIEDTIHLENQKWFDIHNNIAKHHRNILYLLETGDIVEIEYYTKGVTRKFEVLRLADEILFFENLHKEFCYDLKKHKWKEPKRNLKIRRIMTKEEFERKSFNLEVKNG